MTSHINGLPVFKAVLGDEGMVCISFVDQPAVETAFVAYGKKEEPEKYSVADEEKRLVFGVVMRANYPILRQSEDGTFFWMIHTPEVIRQMAEQYIAVRGNCFDTMHNGELEEGIQIVQFMIKDSAKGICPKGFEDIEDGSLFGEFHVTNDEVWASIKSGEYKGFSIEVFEGVEETQGIFSTEKISETILNWINDMGLKEKFKAALSESQKFGSIATNLGVMVWDGDEELKVGDKVFAEGEDKLPLENGEYLTEDGVAIVVEGGEVKAIKSPDDEVIEEVEENASEVEGGEEGETSEEEGEGEEKPEEENEMEKRLAELESKMAEMMEKVASMSDLMASLANEVEQISKEPAAPMAHDAFRGAVAGETKSADRRAANLLRILKA